MTAQEAIVWIKAISAVQKDGIHKNSLLQRKEALHMAIQALEKQIPKKPHKINIANTSWCKGGIRFECPACHKFLGYRELTYCGLCGQKLDWSE